jgi:hypothetical protein
MASGQTYLQPALVSVAIPITVQQVITAGLYAAGYIVLYGGWAWHAPFYFCAPSDESLPTGPSSLTAPSLVEAAPFPLGALERRLVGYLCIIP